jgi:hypothetical protein
MKVVFTDALDECSAPENTQMLIWQYNFANIVISALVKEAAGSSEKLVLCRKRHAITSQKLLPP